MKLIQNKKIEIKSSSSSISFETTGGGSWKVWDRYISIEGKKAYHIGNICGTCNFFFERLDGANQKISQKTVIDQLANQAVHIDSDPYFEIIKLIPVGTYLVFRLQVTPRLVTLGGADDYFANEEINTWGVDGFWGLPHNPRIPYYRSPSFAIDSRSILHNFFIPIVPANWLDEGTIGEYENRIIAGVEPTVICLSYLDVKEPADWQEGATHTQHNCFANIILDGHHKTFVAAKHNRPVNILSFLSLDNSIASESDFQRLVEVLKRNT